MGIELATPLDYLYGQIDDRVRRYYESLGNLLAYAGEAALTRARETHRYIDQTGNLTSSIGYRVIRDGVVLHDSGFEVVKEGGEGAKRGREFIEKLTRENPRGFVFIMVAGMNYAGYVEAMGLGAFDTAEKVAEDTIKRAVAQLGI